jgi:hypothetical protein
MAPPRSLAGAAIAATAAAIILSCNLSLFPHLIVSSSKFPASTSPPSPTCLSGYPTGLFYRRKCARLAARVRELEASLAVTAEKAAAERRGRVRAQQVRSPVAASFRVFQLALLFELGHIFIRLVLTKLYLLALLAVTEGSESAGAWFRRSEADQGRRLSILPAGADWYCRVLLLH